jgi:hypothetical protein
VVEGAQRIESAVKFSGRFYRFENGQLVIDERYITPGFEVTLDFLDSWLHSYVEVFVVNNIAIRIREWEERWGDVVVAREYPPETSKELPF